MKGGGEGRLPAFGFEQGNQRGVRSPVLIRSASECRRTDQTKLTNALAWTAAALCFAASWFPAGAR